MVVQSGMPPLIMVVDDNQEFLEGITLTLEMESFEVWGADSGQQALAEMEDAFINGVNSEVGFDRLPDLILSDIMMPEMDGYEFYKKARAQPYLNNIPFIFLTAKSTEEDIRQGKALGVDDYLPKLQSPEDILASVNGKLKRRTEQRSLAYRLNEDLPKPALGTGLLVGGILVFCSAASCMAGALIDRFVLLG